MNQDRMGQIEKWIFIGCGVLGAIFIGVLILFFVRLGNNTQEVQGMVESQEGTESITENEAVNQEEISKEVPAQTAECGSDASKGTETKDRSEHGGADGGTGAEAQNDGGNPQNDNVTPPPQSRKSRKKRR